MIKITLPGITTQPRPSRPAENATAASSREARALDLLQAEEDMIIDERV